VPDSDIWLGARANEREIKRLSGSGGLAAYRIVHFATHGALARRQNARLAAPSMTLTSLGATATPSLFPLRSATTPSLSSLLTPTPATIPLLLRLGIVGFRYEPHCSSPTQDG
jgi:hypothetical protein